MKFVVTRVYIVEAESELEALDGYEFGDCIIHRADRIPDREGGQ